MAPTIATKSFVFKFADVIVREREFAIVKAGSVQQVEPKAFRVLLMLIRNPSKLIAKEELLTGVWGDTAVTENSLARNIALLRRLLGDDPHEPRFIETVSSIGYRFLCPVEVSEEPTGNLDITRSEDLRTPNGHQPANGRISSAADADKDMARAAAADPQALISDGAGGEAKSGRQKGESRGRMRRWLLPGAAVLLVILTAAIWYLRRPLPKPRVTGYTQITHDGRRKSLAGADGSRLYLNQNSPQPIAQAAISGGEIGQIPVALPDPRLVDVSPNGSSLLVLSQNGDFFLPTLWNVRIPGGSVRRLGEAFSAAFSPDGNFVAYSTADGRNWGGIYVMRSDGTGAHKLASAGEDVLNMAWSPDGGVIRLTLQGCEQRATSCASMWEISLNGSNLHPLLPGWHVSSVSCCGRWTPDGKFFLFLSEGQIWALDERRGLLRQPPPVPIQLTQGPVLWGAPIPDKDGSKIFAEGTILRGELSRFDSKSNQFKPFLGGISAQGVSFSKDGKSIAYVSYPEGILWKANRDGSNPVQLSDPPMQAFLPQWSPDGTQIGFTDLIQFAGYIVSSEGGRPEKFLPEDHNLNYVPNWSPDGHKIVFASAPVSASWSPAKSSIRILDLDSRQITAVPGSLGMAAGYWSPDGRYLDGGKGRQAMIFDFNTQRWSDLPEKAIMDSPQWSMDGQFIYFRRVLGNPGVFRIRVRGGASEKIADLKDWHDAGWWAKWIGLDPTNAPLLLRDIGSHDIYSLTLEQK